MKLLTQAALSPDKTVDPKNWREWIDAENRQDAATQAAILALADAGYLRPRGHDGAHQATESFPDAGISVWVHVITPKTPRHPSGVPLCCHTVEVKFGPRNNQAV